MQGRGCADKNCPNCHRRVMNPEQARERERAEECNYSQDDASKKTDDNKTTADSYDDEYDDLMDEEEESSDDELDQSYSITQVFPEELKAYSEMMDRILSKIKYNEKVMKRMNDLSVEDLVSIIEKEEKQCEEKPSKKKKKKKKNK